MELKEKINKVLESYYEAYPITFDEKKHQYRINGEIAAGVSSVSDYAPKEWMKAWAVKLVVEHIKNNCTKEYYPVPAGEKPSLYYYKVSEDELAEAKNAPNKRSKDALDVGTRTHDWIENHIKGVKLPITDDIRNPVEEFLKFEKKHAVEWIISEKIVCWREHKVAGRVDALALVDGVLSIVDLKTSKQIDEGYFLQTAGYQASLESMGVEGIKQRVILRLPKTQGDQFEAVRVNTDYELDKQAFLNRRYSWQWNNYVDSQFKERVGGSKYKTLKLDKI